MCELITKNYNHYLKYILINTIFLNQNKSRLTDIKLYVNTFNTFKYLREGKKKRRDTLCISFRNRSVKTNAKKIYKYCIKYWYR